jgi:hypothetical protein
MYDMARLSGKTAVITGGATGSELAVDGGLAQI